MVSAVCVFQLPYFLRLASLSRVIAYTAKFVKQKKKIDSYLPSKCVKMRLFAVCDYFFVVSYISANFDTLLALSIANGAIS